VAFRIFGRNVEGLYKLYFVLLLGAIGAFVVAFHADLERLFIAVCVVLSFASLLSAFQNGLLLPSVVTFYDVRIYGIVAVLATLHLGFATLDGQNMTAGRLIAAVYQALMLVLAVHVRMDNLWQVVAIVVWVAAVLAIRGRARLTETNAAIGRRRPRFWPLIVLAASFVGLLVWEEATYDRHYFSNNLPHHLAWHNVGLGFALDPTLGRPYNFEISDPSMVKRVVRYLLERGETDTVARIFGSTYSNPTGTLDGSTVAVATFFDSKSSDLALYNSTARRIVLETVWAYPLETTRTVFLLQAAACCGESALGHCGDLRSTYGDRRPADRDPRCPEL
jgi:hypothetical protein